jgi:hypothetical protein
MVSDVDPSLDTYRNFPEGSAAKETGNDPAANGPPATGLKTPVVLVMENAEMLFEDVFAT